MKIDTENNVVDVYVLFGYPGSGKGTFSQTIKPYDYVHISTGDLLREELKKGSETACQYQKQIEQASSLMPSEIIQKIVELRLKQLLDEKKKVILDGFPKTLEQCKFLDEFMEKQKIKKRVVFVYIDTDPVKAHQRILSRRSCRQCNWIYNIKSSLPKNKNHCDHCKEELTQRKCDNSEDIQKRFDLFEKTMIKVIDFYDKRGALQKIDGNSSIDVCIEKFKDFHFSLNKE